MKSVLIISAVFPPEVAAAGFMAEELAEELVKDGYKVLIIAGWPSYPEGYLFKGWKARFWKLVKNEGNLRIIRVRHIFGNRKKNWIKFLYFLTFGISSFIAGLFQGPFDKVMCFSTPFFGTWSSWLLAKFKKATFFYVMFDLHPESSRNAGLMKGNSLIYRIWYFQDRLLCKISDHIITLSQAMKDEITRRQISKNKINIIPFWIDTERVKPVSICNKWRVDNGIPIDKFVVLYSGTIGYISGAEILIDVARIISNNSNIILLIVGEGVMKEKLITKAAESNCNNIMFLPFQPEAYLNDLLASSDIGIVTLLQEAGKSSIPSKILGYLAAEKPVIASVSEDSGTAELINEGNCGILAKCQDSQSIADAIIYAYTNPEIIHIMGKRGREYIIGKYSKKRCTLQYEKLLMNEPS